MTTEERIDRLERIIAASNRLKPEAIRSHRREAELVAARMTIWLIAYDYMKLSYPRIAKIYGRDHTTIISGCRRARKYATDIKRLVGDIKIEYPGLIGPIEKGYFSIKDWKIGPGENEGKNGG